ncbi:MAG: TetR/AcrR family transcriptional regulator [Hyphomicrobiales bacterium]
MSVTAKKQMQIIHAAVSEFQELGFAGASMDRVAERANVSKRTVYNHFESKEALFKAILELMTDEIGTALDDVMFRKDVPIEKQLNDIAWVEGRLLTSASFMKLARLVMGEITRDRELAAAMNARMEKLSVFNKFFAEAHEAGMIKAPDEEVAADQFLALIKSRAFWPVVFSGDLVSETEMQEIIDNTISTFLKAYSIKN